MYKSPNTIMHYFNVIKYIKVLEKFIRDFGEKNIPYFGN